MVQLPTFSCKVFDVLTLVICPVGESICWQCSSHSFTTRGPRCHSLSPSYNCFWGLPVSAHAPSLVSFATSTQTVVSKTCLWLHTVLYGACNWRVYSMPSFLFHTISALATSSGSSLMAAHTFCVCCWVPVLRVAKVLLPHIGAKWCQSFFQLQVSVPNLTAKHAIPDVPIYPVWLWGHCKLVVFGDCANSWGALSVMNGTVSLVKMLLLWRVNSCTNAVKTLHGLQSLMLIEWTIVQRTP